VIESLWRATWQGSLMVVAIWLVLRCLPNVRPAARARLWWLAALKFLIAPAAIFIPLAILPVSPESSTLRTTPVPVPSIPPEIPTSITPRNDESAISVVRIDPLPWLVLTVGTIWGIVRWIRDSRTVKAWFRDGTWADDTVAGDLLRLLARQMGLRTPPRLMITPNVNSPMVVGPFRPVILLPAHRLPEIPPDELRMLLAHELAHVRRRDLLLAFVPELMVILFFFCPLAWYAKRQWAITREAACDAEAIALTGASPRDYSGLLLKIVSRDPTREVSTALGATTSYHTLKERFQMIQNPTRHLSRMLKLVTLVAVVGCAALVLPWQLKPTKASEQNQKLKTAAMGNLKQLALGLVIYAADYDDTFPPAPTTARAFAVTKPYLNSHKVFKSLNPAGGRILFNPALSEVNLLSIPAPAETPMVYDELPWPDGTRLLAYVDGHVKTVSVEDWIQVKQDLKKTFPKGKAKPRNSPGLGG